MLSRGVFILFSALFFLFINALNGYSQVGSYDGSKFRDKTSSQQKLRGYYGLPYLDREAIRQHEVLGYKSRKRLKMQYKNH